MTSNLNSTVVSHTYLHIILHDYLSCPLFCPISENGHLGNKDLLLNISFCYCSSAEMFLHWLPKTSTVPMTKIFFSSYFSSDPVNDRSSWNFPFPGCYSWLTLLLYPTLLNPPPKCLSWSCRPSGKMGQASRHSCLAPCQDGQLPVWLPAARSTTNKKSLPCQKKSPPSVPLHCTKDQI